MLNTFLNTTGIAKYEYESCANMSSRSRCSPPDLESMCVKDMQFQEMAKKRHCTFLRAWFIFSSKYTYDNDMCVGNSSSSFCCRQVADRTKDKEGGHVVWVNCGWREFAQCVVCVVWSCFYLLS